MDIRVVKIKDIVKYDNSRSKYNKVEMEQLMASIKKDGLLQPIGLRKTDEGLVLNFGNRRLMACKKLGWKEITANVLDEAETEADFIITNLIENEHRSDISDLERGRYFLELTSDKHGLTAGEVAVRMSVTKAKVQQCIRLYSEIPPELRQKVKSGKGGARKQAGTISTGVADYIITRAKSFNLTKATREKLLNFAREDDVSKTDVKDVMKLMSAGASFAKAKAQSSEFKTVTISLPVRNDDWNEYVEQYGSEDRVKTAICKALYGIEEGLVFEKPY